MLRWKKLDKMCCNAFNAQKIQRLWWWSSSSVSCVLLTIHISPHQAVRALHTQRQWLSIKRKQNHWSTKPLSGLSCLLDPLYDNAELVKLLFIQVLINVEMFITCLHTECEMFFKSVLARHSCCSFSWSIADSFCVCFNKWINKGTQFPNMFL